MNKRILIIDDEAAIRETLAGILEDEGFTPLAAGSAEEGLELLDEKNIDLVLLDIWLRRRHGRPDRAGHYPRALRPPAGDHDLRPRHDRNRGAGHPHGRLRFHRKAALLRQDHPRHHQAACALAGWNGKTVCSAPAARTENASLTGEVRGDAAAARNRSTWSRPPTPGCSSAGTTAPARSWWPSPSTPFAGAAITR